MKLRTPIAAVLLTVVAVGRPAVAHETEELPGRRTSMRTVEGTVVELSTLPAEGDLPVVAVTLHTNGPDAERLEVLLAPESVLQDIAFDIEPGDALRARVFVADQGPFRVHKALNLTRGTMVRFRTLSQIPLWNSAGEWDGGPCRRRGGPGGRRRLRHGWGR
jgi:hypothetical protein